MIFPRITSIGTAVPDHDIHAAFVEWAPGRIADERDRALFRRMASRAQIEQRWSVLPRGADGGSPVASGGFYAEDMPGTAARMEIYAETAPRLATEAVEALGEADLSAITHLVVASCTGFTAPGIDQIIAARLGLAESIERTLVGFMGCYGAVTALRTAWHIARSDPAARILVVAVELSTLHLQPDSELEPLLAMLLFGDGAAAAIVSAEGPGFAVERQFSATLPDSERLIRWHVGDTGFAMHLSGKVPARISDALADPVIRRRLVGDEPPSAFDSWAVHAGGRTVLDAVETGLGLPPDALAESRAVLREHGNMSSATLMFALKRLLDDPEHQRGIALAFGPGLAAEGFTFSRQD